MAFVPDDFQPPPGLVSDHFLLEPLGPEHNEDDYEAWSSSIEHIRATPGFRGGRWPHAMTLDENRADLERHARDFAARSGFTYTVLDPSDRGVVGCVYIYPDKDGVDDAAVTSWVRANCAGRDAALRELVSRWLVEAWPFERISYDGPAQALGTIGLRTGVRVPHVVFGGIMIGKTLPSMRRIFAGIASAAATAGLTIRGVARHRHAGYQASQ